MLTFLFWNLKRNNLAVNLRNLAILHDVDILILAEFPEDSSLSTDLLISFSIGGKNIQFKKIDLTCSKIQIYQRVSTKSLSIKPIEESHRYVMATIKFQNNEKFLMVATHLLSLLYVSEDTQNYELTFLGQEIEKIEKKIKHTRTLLVGDFNMNPFAKGMVSAGGIHGISSQKIAAKKTRIVQGREYPYFYNPMWNFLGDINSKNQGTYHYRKADHLCYFWNTFDQVLIRPDLFDVWDRDFLQIVVSDGQNDLINDNGIPIGKHLSDHLPILFRLNLN